MEIILNAKLRPTKRKTKLEQLVCGGGEGVTHNSVNYTTYFCVTQLYLLTQCNINMCTMRKHLLCIVFAALVFCLCFAKVIESCGPKNQVTSHGRGEQVLDSLRSPSAKWGSYS